jgi:hypothetical protein
VDLEKWKADKNGCTGYRAESMNALRDQLMSLQALNEMEIMQLLGKPDQNELYKRNQKFYYYYLQPGPSCSNPAKIALRLAIRFNAVGLAKEVAIE